jgi:hypothetical protein
MSASLADAGAMVISLGKPSRGLADEPGRQVSIAAGHSQPVIL